MKCVVNWIPLRIRVRLRNTQPHLSIDKGLGCVTSWRRKDRVVFNGTKIHLFEFVKCLDFGDKYLSLGYIFEFCAKYLKFGANISKSSLFKVQ